jgi:hypothetical protein
MSKMDEILGPARAIAFGVNAGTKNRPGAVACGGPVADEPKRSVRTYYRRRDGLVTQRRCKTAERSWERFWNQMDLSGIVKVDTCRASSTEEAVRIFKSRPTPEDSEPVREGRHAARH